MTAGQRLPHRPHRDVWDYRGTANDTETLALLSSRNNTLPLGYALSSTVPLQERIGLPLEQLNLHIFLVGPPGRGKTTRFIIPWIQTLIPLRSLFIMDAKGNMCSQYGLDTFAESVGTHCYVWNLQDHNSHRWNFFEEVNSDQIDYAVNDVGIIAKAILGERPDGDNGCFWDRDLSWLKAIMLLLMETEDRPSPSNILSTLVDREIVEMRLQRMPRRLQRLVQNLLSDYRRYSEDELAKAMFTLKDKLSCFDIPSVRRICDGDSDFRLRDFNQSGQRIVVITAQLDDIEESKQLGRVIAGLFHSAMLRRYREPSAMKPVAFIADEAHNLKETVDFENATALLEAQVSLLLGTQKLSQFNTHQKRDRGQRIADNCGTIIALPGVDSTTAQWLSEALGDRADASTTVGRQINSRNYTSDGSRRTLTLGVREIRKRPPEMEWTAIVQTPNSKPFFCRY